MMKTSSEMPGYARPLPLPEFLTQARKLVDSELDRLLPAESVSPTNIHAAIRWSVFAGDALLTLAFKTVSEDANLSTTKRAVLISEIAQAAGTPEGMVAGQAYDLEAESQNVAAAELERIHRLKTGALITAAARAGGIIADTSKDELKAVTEYAGQLGLLFQITDDLLDVTATAETIGKTPGKDARSRKATYPALYGIEATRKHLATTHAAACAALARIDRPTELLRSIADFILRREA